MNRSRHYRASVIEWKLCSQGSLRVTDRVARDIATAGHRLCSAFAAALHRASQPTPASDAFTRLLIPELESAHLSVNPRPAITAQPESSLELLGQQPSNPLLDAVHALGPLPKWIRALDFYPEPEHRHFTENVWGVTLIGEEDALLHAAGHFIALLIVIDAHTHYPLHAHRIEELYCVIAGTAEWSHDGESWQTMTPGEVFHNPGWQAHTMRTGAMPVMAMGFYLPPFGWEGGLVGISPGHA